MKYVLTTPLDDERLLGLTLRQHVERLPVPAEAHVVLDPRCPLVPAEFVASLVEAVARTGRPHAGVLPVTDTVKAGEGGGFVGRTVDRSGLRQLASPVVLPSPRELPATLIGLLAALDDVVLVEAPGLARRVADADEIRLLEALASQFRLG